MPEEKFDFMSWSDHFLNEASDPCVMEPLIEYNGDGLISKLSIKQNSPILIKT